MFTHKSQDAWETLTRSLIEAGVRANRSDAAAWLIQIGLESKSAVLEAVKDKVAEIRRIREDARVLAEDAEKHD